MFGLLPILKGWLFLSLYARLSINSKSASSSFITINDVLSFLIDSDANLEEANNNDHSTPISIDPLNRYTELLMNIYSNHRKELESFLSKLMHSQENLEGNIGFSYDESKIVDSLEKIIEAKVLSEEALPVNPDNYFKTRWNYIDEAYSTNVNSTTNINNTTNSNNGKESIDNENETVASLVTINLNIISTALILDNLKFYLSETIFTTLCGRFKLKLIEVKTETENDENNPNKHLKLLSPTSDSSLILKTIKPSTTSFHHSPSDDYTKFNGTLRPEKAKNSKFAVVGNTSMLSFFKKTSNDTK